ncbi:MAG: DedA family protein [Spirochaetales bacterium]|nr:DedA family protein [Leptospiraceae bacterium]MCP5480136.1 DedA family protein [Spirochaetales bacterium]MCP5485524.1 DedA family protein [Spirochaetales bacterium]
MALEAQTVIDWITRLPPAGVYVFLAVSSVIENVFPPWPGDTVTVFGGLLIAQNVIDPVASMLSLLVGNLIGAYTMYFGGRRILGFARHLHRRLKRPEFLLNWLRELTSLDQMRRAEHWFRRWGVQFVLVSRFSAGIRFFVSIIAGISHMNFAAFTVSFSIGVLLWNTLLLGGGFLLGDNWEIVLEWLRLYNVIVISSIALAIVAYIVFRIVRGRRTDSPAS